MYEIYAQLRNKKGVKDSDVAKATGITKSTFTDWKNGRSTPKDEKLQKIADYFDVSTYYLRTGKQVKTITVEAEPIQKSLDSLRDEMAPGLSQVMKMYIIFDEYDRNEILKLMKDKLKKYFDDEPEKPDERISAG